MYADKHLHHKTGPMHATNANRWFSFFPHVSRNKIIKTGSLIRRRRDDIGNYCRATASLAGLP